MQAKKWSGVATLQAQVKHARLLFLDASRT